jgi:hypothetical protein
MKFSPVLVILSVLTGSEAKSRPSISSLQKQETARMLEIEHDISENVRKFQENLEGLKTTVDFEPMVI